MRYHDLLAMTQRSLINLMTSSIDSSNHIDLTYFHLGCA